MTLQGADFYRFRVGAITLSALWDGTAPQDLHALLTNITQAETDALLVASFLRSPIEASINAFLIALTVQMSISPPSSRSVSMSLPVVQAA